MTDSTICLSGIGYDFKASDFSSTPSPDVTNFLEYTPISPVPKQKNCDEYWTLAPTTAGAHVKCVRQTVVIDGPMNKLGSTTTIKDDVDIGYREMAISAGWYLFKQGSAMSGSTFSTSSNYFAQNAPSLLTFNAQTVDFTRFLEPEPDTTFILATRPSVCVATTLLAVAFATLF